MVKGIKLKEKSKRKKKGVRIQAIIGRIRTRDPDPGHFGPDLIPGPDSDPRLRIWVRVLALKHGLFGLFTDFLRTFSDSICT